ncbi:MAG TPA: glycerol-3-phosphate 1-O-acyltransferase PlsY [Syntrophorhabdaceae bacterium]|nr:glycerol-3-phosphate 1-O-acyltransferase PlsY [Syntrophorhabdaceae bacterium]
MTLQAFFVIVAYLIGSIPVGLLLSKIQGKDPRNIGSGNIGATNVMRTAGKTAGIVTLLGDVAKGFLPVMIANYYSNSSFFVSLIGFSAFIGHLYPVYLRFKGGKGVATALGVYLAISPLAILIDILIFTSVLFKWRYVSLGSLVGTFMMPVILIILGKPYMYIILSILIGIFIFIKHRDNIRRLAKGEENKFKT